jgi:thiol-disulfide isomerase/thioredoxin
MGRQQFFSATMASETPSSNPIQNIIIALVAIALAVALFLGQRFQPGGASLSAQASAAMPLDSALASGKPTLMEFYADWCTSCQAMAPSLAKVKKDYGQTVNFSMLNVDNTKWLPEIEKYRVDGIPHFVFFNQAGAVLGQVIGEQPEVVLRSTLDEIVAGRIKPIDTTTGQTSRMPNENSAPTSTDPRGHGAQVKSS